MNCPYCSKVLTEKLRFCPYCRQAIPESAYYNASSNAPTVRQVPPARGAAPVSPGYTPYPQNNADYFGYDRSKQNLRNESYAQQPRRSGGRTAMMVLSIVFGVITLGGVVASLLFYFSGDRHVSDAVTYNVQIEVNTQSVFQISGDDDSYHVVLSGVTDADYRTEFTVKDRQQMSLTLEEGDYLMQVTNADGSVLNVTLQARKDGKNLNFDVQFGNHLISAEQRID